jgi:molecular chaperone GrpE
VEDSIKEALMSRFRAYLDAADAGSEPLGDQSSHDQHSGDPDVDDAISVETADLYSVFVEMAALRTEVRTESRLVKEALDQFRRVFDLLQASHSTVQQELDRARAGARDQANAALRPLLLDVIDLRDRLLAALKLAAAVRPRWTSRLLRRNGAASEPWQDGMRMTLRRLDQVLLDRRVAAIQLVGQPFDPRIARVVATSLDASAAEGTVIEELRTGFLWDSQVLRTAEVVVSKAGVSKGEHA